MDYPMKHVSILVPWHDTGWEGRVCDNPRGNSSCLRLERIANKRDDDAEESIAGQSIENLERARWPACIAERAAFMAPFEYDRMVDYPYFGKNFDHFKTTRLRYPRYSAPAVPFKWPLLKEMEKLDEEYGLDVQLDREPELGLPTK